MMRREPVVCETSFERNCRRVDAKTLASRRRGTRTRADAGAEGRFEREYARNPVPVYVMLPLNVVTNDGEVNDPETLENGLRALKDVGVEGVMIDVWWGIVERAGPKKYDWEAYKTVIGMIREMGLKVQAVMSFHACGANVGDVLEIPLPEWVLEAGDMDPDLFFTDQYGTAIQSVYRFGQTTRPRWLVARR